MSSLIEYQQGSASAPAPDGFTTATNPVNPLLDVLSRLSHFDEDIYDLSAESHLVKLLKVMLGEAGVGGVQRSLLLVRLQQQLSTTHYFDLDRFYGAILGVTRTQSEVLGVDPHVSSTDLASWDEINLRDASYRSRAGRLSAALQLGPSVAGLKAVARAMTGQECDLIEGWVDGYQLRSEWSDLEGEQWGSLGPTWGDLEQGTAEGIEVPRNQVSILVPTQLSPGERLDLIRALDRVRPAQALIDVISSSENQDERLGFSAFSPSERWEIRSELQNSPLADRLPFDEPSDVFLLPAVPPWGAKQGEAWSALVTEHMVVTYATEGRPDTASSVDARARALPIPRIEWRGSTASFPADLAMLSLGEIRAGRSVSGGVLQAHPYGDREGATGMWIDGVEEGFVPPLTGPSQRSRFWVTPSRPGDSPDHDSFEIRFQEEVTANHISWSMAHFPHELTIEYWDSSAAEWVQAYFERISGAVPYTVGMNPPLTAQHPMHYGDRHWVKRSVSTPLIQANKWRFVMTRIPDSGPVGIGNEPIPYSLALRSVDIGMRIANITDVPNIDRGSPIATTVNASGLRDRKALHLASADLTEDDALTAWYSEPQPTKTSSVSLYARMDRPGVVNRVYVDPVYTGLTMNLYWTPEVSSGSSQSEPLERPLRTSWRGSVSPGAQGLAVGEGVAFTPSPAPVGEDWFLASEWFVSTTQGPDVLRPMLSTVANGHDVAVYSVNNTIGFYVRPVAAEAGERFRLFTVDLDESLGEGSRIRVIVSEGDLRVRLNNDEVLVGVEQAVSPTGDVGVSLDSFGVEEGWIAEDGSRALLLIHDTGLTELSATTVFSDDNTIVGHPSINSNAMLTRLALGAGNPASFMDTPDSLTLVNYDRSTKANGVALRFHPSYRGRSNGSLISVGFMGGLLDVWENTVWNPVGQYAITKGYIDIPDVSAAAFKMEFSNLSPQMWETFLPSTTMVEQISGEISSDQARSMPALEDEVQAITAPNRFPDLVRSVIFEQDRLSNYISPVAGLVVQDETQREDLARRNGYTFNLSDWQQSSQAPLRTGVSSHASDASLVRTTSRMSFFVGIREIGFVRRNDRRTSNSPSYTDTYLDADNLDLSQTTMQVEPGQVFTPENETTTALLPTPQYVTSKTYSSYSPVRAVQIASQQTQSVQMIPDDEFRSPDLRGSNFIDLDGWHPSGDGILVWDSSHNTVKLSRNPSVLDTYYAPDTPVVHPPVTPVVASGFARVISVNEGASGGISSPFVQMTGAGVVYAACRVSVDQELEQDLFLRIYGADGTTLLAEQSFRPRVGGISEIVLQFTSPLPGADSATIQVRVEQDGGSFDEWIMHSLSCFDPSIAWDVSNDGGETWMPATSALDLADGIVQFPEGGTLLTYRATCYRYNAVIDAVRLRPVYLMRRGAEL